MPDLDVRIDGYVTGDNLEIRRTITGLPFSIAMAWITVKRHHRLSDAEADLQKAILPADEEGVGQVETVGDSETAGVIRFDLTPADTLALGTGTYLYDIQIQLEDGKIYTAEAGTLRLMDQVTKAPETDPEP